MAEKTLQSRIIQKHDTAANWALATNFIPKLGEIIIYDADDNNSKPKIKIGNGIDKVSDLEFFSSIGNAQGVYYIEGTGTTAGTWLGSHEDIKEYYPGLSVLYKIPIAGASTTKLNINNLGAVSVVKNVNTAISTSYAVNSIVNLIYTLDGTTAYWKIADYDTNTRNSAGTTNKVDTKLFLVGAASQSSYVTTYSNANAYIGTDNNLYSNGKKVATVDVATTSTDGLMSSTDKTKLDGIATGANKTVVDTALNSTSTNPVQNKVVNSAISAKQNTVTGAATTVTDSNLTASRALVSNSSGKIAVSAVTSTELGYLDGVTSAIQTQLNAKVPTSRTINGKALTGNITLTASDVGIDPDNISESVLAEAKTYTDNKITGLKGANSGLAELDANGKVPSSQLPSYVDDVLEYANLAGFPATGESGKIYIAQDTNKSYRWSGSAYVEVSSSLALGETSSTAYRGDRGAAAYKHAVTNKGIAKSNGLYKITTNSEGHVTAATAVAKADITGLGIPAQDTTYSAATTSAAGLMSAADKAKLDGIASGATANTGDITGVTAGNGLTGGGSSGSVTLNVGAGSGITVAADTVSVNTGYTTSGKNYKVAVDSSSGGLYVNVPWTDNNTWKANSSSSEGYVASGSGQANKVWKTDANGAPAWRDDANTTYSAATQSAAGLMSAADKTKLDGITGGTVQQLRSTSASWRALLTHYTAAAEGTNPGETTNKVYYNEAVSIQPSTGTLRATAFKGSGASLTSLNASNISSGTIAAARLPAATTSAQGAMTADMVTKLNGIETGANKYSLPTASSSTLGGVKIGSGVTISSGVISVTASGIGAAPTSHASTATTYGAASASNYGHAMASSTTPKALGTAAVGSETAKFARGDHVHALPALTSCTGTLTVAKGGTGATTATGARENLLIKVSETAPSSPTTGTIWIDIS